MSEHLGTVVVDEVVIAKVIRVHLEAGSFVVTAAVEGPLAARDERQTDLRVHGLDGSLVMSGRTSMGWGEVGEGEQVFLSFRASSVDKHFTEEDG